MKLPTATDLAWLACMQRPVGIEEPVRTFPKGVHPPFRNDDKVYLHDDPNRKPKPGVIVGRMEKMAKGTDMHHVRLIETGRKVVVPASLMTRRGDETDAAAPAPAGEA